jgi:hypothetical protein
MGLTALRLEVDTKCGSFLKIYRCANATGNFGQARLRAIGLPKVWRSASDAPAPVQDEY